VEKQISATVRHLQRNPSKMLTVNARRRGEGFVYKAALCARKGGAVDIFAIADCPSQALRRIDAELVARGE